MMLGKIKDFFIRTRKQLEKEQVGVPCEIKEELFASLELLQKSLIQKNRSESKKHYRILHEKMNRLFPKSFFRSFLELCFSIMGALLIAVIIRQMWFEPYEIPSGSMRPTLLEGDLLVVSKNHFSLNYPLSPGHLYFNRDGLKRMEIVTFTGKEMDIPHSETRYFYLFPGHKEYVKRLIGMPGDVLYFYGGKVYGLDHDQNDITPQLQPPSLNHLEQIPFLHMEKVHHDGRDFIFSQFNTPVGKISLQGSTLHKSLLYPAKEPLSESDLFDLWGIAGFGMTRLVHHSQLPLRTAQALKTKAPFYLEIIHHPSLKEARLERDLTYGKIRPVLSHSTSYLPLEQADLENLFSHLYTSRFIMEKGYMRKDGTPFPTLQTAKATLPYLGDQIPDGKYEFYHGQLYQIGFQTHRKKITKEHPLAQFQIDRFFQLFNFGIELDKRIILPGTYNLSYYHPARYVYFRDGDLYAMGHLFLDKQSPLLQEFIKEETNRAHSAPVLYHPFIDAGPPLLPDGSLDKNKILTYGFKVPPNKYLLLGDNHANSGDCREFGCVPEANLRGTPSFAFWAPGKNYIWSGGLSWLSLPKATTWITAIIAYLCWYLYREIRVKKPLNRYNSTSYKNSRNTP